MAEAAQHPRRIRAVLFDVDFTLVRPGPDLSPEGYRRLGERHGLALDPAKYDEARHAALDSLQHHPELEHDDEIWVAFTERIVNGMGGHGPGAHAAAREMVSFWEVHDKFELYEDARPVLAELRRHGLKIALISNTARDLEEFVAHHRIDVDASAHGRVKPHRSIFDAVLERLGVRADEAAMVGDSPLDDIEGARALGIHAFLLDREARYAGAENRLPDLFALPAALGLSSAGATRTP